MAVTTARVFGLLVLFAVTGFLIGVPVVGTIRKNRRASDIQAGIERTAHMEGWVPGTTVAFKARRIEGELPASAAPGPRIVGASADPARGWVTIVNGPAPARPDFSQQQNGGDRPDSPGLKETGVEQYGGQSEKAGRDLGGIKLAVSIHEGAFRPPPYPAIAEGEAWAKVIGHPVIEPQSVEAGRRTELACYLALHNERPMKKGEVEVAIFSAGDDAKASHPVTLRRIMGQLRESLGPDLVPAAEGGMYALSKKVMTDWHAFRDLVKRAKGTVELDRLTEALVLVRGGPFSGVADNTYVWSWKELIVEEIEVAVLGAAKRVAAVTLAAENLAHAEWAAHKGLVVCPFDRELWRMQLEIAGRRGAGELERVYERARASLGEDVGDLDSAVGALR